jgi:hypothetical protein
MSSSAPSPKWFVSIPWDYEGMAGTNPAPPIIRQLLGEDAGVQATSPPDPNKGQEPPPDEDPI